MTKKLPLLFLAFALCNLQGFSQATSLEVYQIFQDKCVSCHGNLSPSAGLDLEGSGSTELARLQSIYNNIVDGVPANSYAAAQGYKNIYPGRPDLSYIFRKVNKGLESTIDLESEEGLADPPESSDQLSDYEKEMIRQWILYGAPVSGEVVNTQLIEDFYNGEGLASFEVAPPAPDPSEGFQIKMGPFYLNRAGQPGEEVEYFQKYELDLPANVDVNRVDIKIAGSSHHFLLYNFDSPSLANNVNPGFRLDPDHSGIGLVAAVQETTDLKLPEGTAFIWDNDLVLDLNSHYINYDAGRVLQAEAYINIYTQPEGSAAQEMETALIVEDNIWIPNNEELITETGVVNDNFGQLFLWGIMGHTHQWGRDYKIYRREAGARTDLIYDASCAEGIPGCVSPNFDYQHIPMRFFEPLEPLIITPQNGFIHEAQWVNYGPQSVGFGPTSDDEMMVTILMYTTDTVGVITDVNEVYNPLKEVKVFPNPMSESTTIQVPHFVNRVEVELFDLMGRQVRLLQNQFDRHIVLEKENLLPGMYIYQITDDKGNKVSDKLVIR